MFSKTGLYLIIWCIILSFLNAEVKQCDETEEYLECGSACPPTCDNPKPEICTLQCVAGCFCKKGFIKDNKTGKCVKNCDDKKCNDPNEYYNNCGTSCPATCENPNPRPCNKMCSPGCFCKPGYLRQNSTGRCVPKQCSECDKNEIYNECGSACPSTCENPKPRSCSRICVPGCFCKSGFLKHASTGKCAPAQQCAKCGPNEYYTDCGSYCPPTCDKPKSVACIALCRAGCFCESGYLRNSTGGCELAQRCAKCGPHEHYTDCGTLCPATCENPKPHVCSFLCVEGCFCDDRYLRKNGTCVCKDDC